MYMLVQNKGVRIGSETGKAIPTSPAQSVRTLPLGKKVCWAQGPFPCTWKGVGRLCKRMSFSASWSAQPWDRDVHRPSRLVVSPSTGISKSEGSCLPSICCRQVHPVVPWISNGDKLGAGDGGVTNSVLGSSRRLTAPHQPYATVICSQDTARSSELLEPLLPVVPSAAFLHRDNSSLIPVVCCRLYWYFGENRR